MCVCMSVSMDVYNAAEYQKEHTKKHTRREEKNISWERPTTVFEPKADKWKEMKISKDINGNQIGRDAWLEIRGRHREIWRWEGRETEKEIFFRFSDDLPPLPSLWKQIHALSSHTPSLSLFPLFSLFSLSSLSSLSFRHSFLEDVLTASAALHKTAL